MPRTTIRSEDVTDAQIKTADMAVDPTNASNLASGSVPLAQLGNAPATDLGPTEDDIAVLGFQVAAASDLAKYSLRDQIVDTFQDTSGVDAGASTGETRNATGKYYSGSVASTGGTITTYGAYTLYTFLLADTGTNLVAGSSGLADILIVAGGAGGGSHPGGGGGGAGGFKYYSQTTVASGNNAVVVGAGGAGDSTGYSGGNSSFAALVSTGGGGGTRGDQGSSPAGIAGGSGGGGGGRNSTAGGAGMANQGNDGGTATSSSNNTYDSGGGGGGASAAGTNASGSTGGNGGAGYTEGATVYDWESASGTVTFPTNFYNGSTNSAYAGGGGGGSEQNQSGIGGTGGGGNAGTNATDNTGGGGGGVSGNKPTPGDGGNGIVIVRTATGALDAGNDMTLVSTANTAEAGTTDTGDLVILYTPETGTTVLNTNLKAYVSRDNGTTYTQATLVGKGSYSGTTQIASAHDLNISGQPAGTSMRWKVETLVQSSALVTRVNGVSLGWS